MRVLGLDVGDKRIGVALSDSTGFLASPLTTLQRRSPSVDIDEVLRIADEEEARKIVVGLPLSLSGDAGPQARRTAQFTEDLSNRAPVPVVSFDERYSTVEAERLLREAGVQPSKNKARVDAAAAAVILQGYLNSMEQRTQVTGDADIT